MNVNYGKIAYDAYKNSSGGVSLISGVRLPEWDSLKLEIQQGWTAGALAVLKAQEDSDA